MTVVGFSLLGTMGNNSSGILRPKQDITCSSLCSQHPVRTFKQMRATVKVVDNLGSKRVICVQALKGRKMKKGDIVYGMIGASPPRVHQSLTTAFCLADDSVDCSIANVKEVDPTLAVKKKAMEISPELRGTSIFLVGMTSGMKSNLGKLLADALRYYYFESDNLVEEAAAGVSAAANSFRERDMKAFRESETEVLKQLSSMGRLVVCAGDGAVQSRTNLALLRHGISIWIDVPLEMVAREVMENGNHRLASQTTDLGSCSDVVKQLGDLFEEMKSGYATADATISLQRVANQLGYDDMDSVSTEDMVMKVLVEIEKLTRVKKLLEDAARPF